MARQPIFPYGKREISWLGRDPALGRAIAALGHIHRKLTPDPFTGIARAIAGQQISGHAHAAIWSRLLSRFSPFTPSGVLEIGPENLRQCGLSCAKTRAIIALATEFAAGSFKNALWEKLDESEIARLLLAIPGIGPWTVEMALIFTFQRKNILSFKDLGIRRGMSILYGVESVDKDFFERKKACYAPFGTIAGFYLWEIAAGKLTQNPA